MGRDTDQIKKSLNGPMSFNFKDGAIIGFNLGKALRGFKSLRKTGPFKVSEKEETDFSEITGNPVAEKGVARLDDFIAQIPGIRVTGKGVLADLPKDRIDYRAKATVVATSKGQGGKQLAELSGFTIPVNIRGTLVDPNVQVDILSAVGSTGIDGIKNILGVLPIDISGATKADGTKTDGKPATDAVEDAAKKLLKGISIVKQTSYLAAL